MEKATEAREKNEQGAELDAISLAVVNSIASDLTGLVNTTALKQGLTGLVKGNLDTIIDPTKTEWEVEGNTGRLYKITNTGNVEIASTVNITKDGEIVTELSYNSDEIELNTTTIQLNATPTPDLTINSVTWESGTPSVASIDNTGLVTLKDKGSTTITLTANTTGGNFTKTCTIEIVKPIEIGDTVTYLTTLNNTDLTMDWKVFYKQTIDNTEYTWIILKDYLPNSYVSISNITPSNSYAVYSNNRTNLLNAMTTTANWNSLLSGTLNGKTIDYTSTEDTNIKAMGSPTLELWRDSWNENYTGTTNDIYINQTSSAMSDGYNGYYVNKGSAASTSNYNTNLSTAGTISSLYFPHTRKWNKTDGYWLASPSAVDTFAIMYVNYDINVAYNGCYNTSSAFRPVICLPSSVFE